MDQPTLDSLLLAFKASPDNSQLLVVLLRACLELKQLDQAYQLLETTGYPSLQDRELAASVCLGAGHPQAALDYLLGDAPADSGPARILRARAYAALEQRDLGLEEYQAAIAENPTLEDTDLAALLESRSRVVQSGSGSDVIQLKVYANDNTDESELNRLLVPQEDRLCFDDVGGLESLKKQVRKKIILPFQKPSLFARYKKKVGGGILLYGPPGCGKTLLARATAGECDAAFFSVAISDVLDMYIGESEQKLHALFEKARGSAPAVLFFDEIEALGGKRQYTRESTSSKLVSQFLAEMDGFSQNNQGVLILGATNVPWAVDAAFRRPGRFDRVLFVPPPDQKARLSILEIHLRDRPVSGDLKLPMLAKQSSGFSGADLQNVVETAIDEAIEAALETGQEVPIQANHLLAALKQVKSTTLEWLTTARNYARYANEAGHYDEVLDFLKRHGKS